MAKNFIQPGYTLEFTAPVGGVVSGRGYLIGDTFVVALTDALAGQLFNGRADGVFSLPKAATVTPAQGVKLYWINASSTVTNVATGNVLIGTHAGTATAGAADATIPVRLGIVA